MVVACLAVTAVSADAPADVAKDVAKARGLTFAKPVAIERVGVAELRARAAAAAPDRADEAAALARWGIGADGFGDGGSDGGAVAAFYDGSANAIVAGSDAADDALVPALERALIDQRFAAHEKAADVAATDRDARRARLAVERGDALALAIEVALARAGQRPPWDDPELTAAIAAQVAPGDGESLDRAGLEVVAAERRGRGKSWRAIDAIFKRPPATTAQLLHPALFAAHRAPIAIAAAAPPSLAGWSLAESDVWGEFGARVFLRAHGVAGVVAHEAAAGWAGDREATFVRDADHRALAAWRSEWGSEHDAVAAQAAIERAVDDQVHGAVAEHTETLTRWTARDGTIAWVEQRGAGVIAAIGVPADLAPAVQVELWTALAPKKVRK